MTRFDREWNNTASDVVDSLCKELSPSGFVRAITPPGYRCVRATYAKPVLRLGKLTIRRRKRLI